MKKSTSLSFGILSSILLGIGSVSPAFADSSARIPGIASASFTSNGDIFKVTDLKRDGRGAYLFWRIPSTGQAGECADFSSAGAGKTCNYSFRKGQTIFWILCAIDAQRVVPPVCIPNQITDRT